MINIILPIVYDYSKALSRTNLYSYNDDNNTILRHFTYRYRI